MTRKLNLSMLNKKKEEISKIEMKKAIASGYPDIDSIIGVAKCTCDPTFISADVFETDQWRECECGSIWVVFGLLWG
jgi:hypothetical protein